MCCIRLYTARRIVKSQKIVSHTICMAYLYLSALYAVSWAVVVACPLIFSSSLPFCAQCPKQT